MKQILCLVFFALPIAAQITGVIPTSVNTQSGATYTLLSSDNNKLVNLTGASPAVTIPTAGGSFPNGWHAWVTMNGSGTATLTPASGTIDGAASATIAASAGAGLFLATNGTNWFSSRGVATSSGTGDVVGPGSATDNCVARFDGTTGKLIQNSVLCVSDTGDATTPGGISTGVGGTVAGYHQFVQGTATTPAANSVLRQAPTSVPTAYSISEPSAAGTGFLFGTNVANVMTSAYVQPWAVNPQTTTYQVLAADFASCKTITVASGAFTITLVASGAQPPNGQCVKVINYGTGVVTIARSGQNINGATITIPVSKVMGMVWVVSDGANYFAYSTWANPMSAIGDIPITNASGLPSRVAVGVANETLHGGTVPVYGPVVGADMTVNTVTSRELAVVNTRRTACIVIGANNAASAISDADLGPQSRQYFLNSAQTLVEIEVSGDAGTPNIIIGSSRAGSIVNLTSAALATASSGGIACSNTGGTTGIDGATTCSATLQNTALLAGDWITLVSGTAGGVAKQMSACFTTTINP